MYLSTSSYHSLRVVTQSTYNEKGGYTGTFRGLHGHVTVWVFFGIAQKTGRQTSPQGIGDLGKCIRFKYCSPTRAPQEWVRPNSLYNWQSVSMERSSQLTQCKSMMYRPFLFISSIDQLQALPIATNQVTKQEMEGIPHYFVGEVSFKETDYNVFKFQQAALPLVSYLSPFLNFSDREYFGGREASYHRRRDESVHRSPDVGDSHLSGNL